MTQYISNPWHIRANSARVDWSNAVQASSVQVQKNRELVRAQSKNSSDWIGLDLDGPCPDWFIAGLVESLHDTRFRHFGSQAAFDPIGFDLAVTICYRMKRTIYIDSRHRGKKTGERLNILTENARVYLLGCQCHSLLLATSYTIKLDTNSKC